MEVRAEGENVGYVVRYAASGVNVYSDASCTGTAIATLPNGTALTVLGGPWNRAVLVQTTDTGIQGYVDVQYVKRTDAIVQESERYTYDEMVEDVVLLSQRYPDLLRVNAYPAPTADGRMLYDLAIGSATAPKTMLVHAGIHAREDINPLLIMEQLEMCLDFYYSGSYQQYTYEQLFQTICIHIVPMVNPDGISISQLGEKGIRTPEILQLIRNCYQNDKNSRRTKADYGTYLTQWKANAKGVDLNRNFEVGFGYGATVLQPSSKNYPGICPGSEVESQFMMNLVAQIQPSAVINYHSMGEVMYWQCVENKYSAENREYANLMAGLTGYYKMQGQKSNGGFLEYVLGRGNKVYAVTLETGPIACPLSIKYYPEIWSKNYMAWLVAAEYLYAH